MSHRLIDKNIEMTNAGGYLVLKDTASNWQQRFSVVQSYNLETQRVVLSDGDSYDEFQLSKFISPTIADAASMQTWLDGLALGGSVGTVTVDNSAIVNKLEEIKLLDHPAPTPPRNTQDITGALNVPAGFYFLTIEAPQGIPTGGTVIIDGVTYDDAFVYKEFNKLENASAVAINANGNNLHVKWVI